MASGRYGATQHMRRASAFCRRCRSWRIDSPQHKEVLPWALPSPSAISIPGVTPGSSARRGMSASHWRSSSAVLCREVPDALPPLRFSDSGGGIFLRIGGLDLQRQLPRHRQATRRRGSYTCMGNAGRWGDQHRAGWGDEPAVREAVISGCHISENPDMSKSPWYFDEYLAYDCVVALRGGRTRQITNTSRHKVTAL